MPALYPANPWTFGFPPSGSGQLEKWGMGLSLRFRGEKPIEPCRGRCSFGTGHAPRKVTPRCLQRDAGECTPPWRCVWAQKIRTRTTGIRMDCPGRLVGALGRPYGGGLYSFLEEYERWPRFLSPRFLGGESEVESQRASVFGFAFDAIGESMPMGRIVSSSFVSSSSCSASWAIARQYVRTRDSEYSSHIAAP